MVRESRRSVGIWKSYWNRYSGTAPFWSSLDNGLRSFYIRNQTGCGWPVTVFSYPTWCHD